MEFSGKKIILGVSGGIAAYKAADLASRMKKAGAEVRVAMTPAAKEFVAPLTFEAISGQPVYGDVFGDALSYRMEHIEWARWADALVIAPASTDCLARMAHGLANDALLALYLAYDGPVWVAPAMNTVMWEHPATRANVEMLRQRGVRIVGPGAGPLACGEIGEGRMSEPSEIIEALESGLYEIKRADSAGKPLAGKTVLITAGPTRESLDPIRFVSNRSTGRMGTAIAARAAQSGAKVILIHGPLSVPVPKGVEAVGAESSELMLKAVQSRLAESDIAIFSAAVANYRPAVFSTQKIKGGDRLQLDMVRNPDIAGWAGANRYSHQVLVGFAAESEDLIESAKRKLRGKKLDLIFANPIGVPGIGFVSDDNAVSMIDRENRRIDSGRMSKDELADWILSQIISFMRGKK